MISYRLRQTLILYPDILHRKMNYWNYPSFSFEVQVDIVKLAKG